MSPLLNCPFCGGRAEIWKAQPGTTRKAWIACMTNRCAVLTREHLSDAEAVAAWNRRAPQEQSAAGHPVAVDGGKQAASEASELKDAPAAINRSGEP